MKSFFLLLSVLLISATSFSQKVPQGMKYQGVARDLKGNILSEQTIVLKITLSATDGNAWKQHYVETHKAVTSNLGLFTLVVGEGAVTTGKFASVPWSTDEIWMEVSIKDNAGFATISNSKLMAVPYAFHALTANQLAGSSDANLRGIPSNTWSTFGNTKTNPATDALGTADDADLIIITRDVERIRVLKEGNILIKRSLTIGADLTVDSTVNLNKVKGQTINHGPFTVANTSESKLTGKLTVDKETLLNSSLTVANKSKTTLSGELSVDKNTDLNAALNVDGKTDLNSDLNVNNKMPTKLTGTLDVDSITNIKNNFFVSNKGATDLSGTLSVAANGTFKEAVILSNDTLQQDTASLVPGGALRVAGGGGFGGNLTVAGSAKIGGGLSLSNLNITGPKESTSSTTGALTVAGGVGIKKQVNVDGATTINNSLRVNAGNNQVVITGGSAGDQSADAAYPLVVQGKNQGIQVKLSSNSNAGRSNNYLTFKDGSGNTRGRIEGQTAADLDSDPWYKWDVLGYSKKIGESVFQVASAAKELAAAASDVRPCAGLGVVVCPPSAGTIVVKTIILAARIVGLALDTKALVDYQIKKKDYIGVVYSSGSGDYAEWLPREQGSVKLKPGQVVGIHKGYISLTTKGADRVLVISTNPIVLGNTPDDGTESSFEKVAFLGQVPVRVRGRVTAGDYILASNNNDGYSIAKHPEEITIEDLPNFVGIAWTSSSNEAEKAVKVAVGISSSDIKLVVQQLDKKVNNQTDELNELRKQMNSNNALLAKLILGYKAPLLEVNDNLQPAKQKELVAAQPVTVEEIMYLSTDSSNNIPEKKFDIVTTKKVYNEAYGFVAANLQKTEGNRLPVMTDDFIDKLLAWGIANEGAIAKDGAKSAVKGNSDNLTLLQEIQADPALKKKLYNNIKESYKQGIEEVQIAGN